jgi:glucose-6-phosphate 1-dehydrogenase
VHNILAGRFANGVLHPVWNHQHVCYVQIDVPEQIDIQGRAEFMESTGTFRDMISTHLFQLLAFVALDPPARMDGDSLHHETAEVFRALRPPDPDRVVLGQYEPRLRARPRPDAPRRPVTGSGRRRAPGGPR